MYIDGTWSGSGPGFGQAVSCVPGSALTGCVILFDNGNGVTFDPSEYGNPYYGSPPGSGWSASDISIDPFAQNNMHEGLTYPAVSCPLSGFCMDVGSDNYGYAFAIENPNSVPYTIVEYKVDPYSTPVGAFLDSVACPSTSFCLAVDNLGNTFMFNGIKWSGIGHLGSGPLAPQGSLPDQEAPGGVVSCMNTTECVAIFGGEAYTLSAPNITEVSPESGPTAGGTKVTITGGSLTGASVRFGSKSAKSVSVNTAGTKITAYSPAEMTGGVPITVTNRVARDRYASLF